jgi:hypothetical protein
MGTSLFEFVGRIGNMVYYKLDKKPVKRRIGKVDLEKMRTAPQYEETRKNQYELGVAASGGKLFREGLLQFTKGFTIHSYASDVVSILLNTLRSDTTQPKGQKQITNGLKNVASQLAFNKLNIFSKRETSFYKNTLLRKTNDGKSWRLNRNILFGKGVKGDQMSVKIGYYHVDFEGSIANYKEVLSMACHRNEMIEFSDFKLPKSNKNNTTPWTFIIVQVWREGSFQDITGMTYMSIVDVVDNDALNGTLDEINEPLLHKCGREMEEGHGSHGSQMGKGAKVSGLQSGVDSSVELMHVNSHYREDIVKFGGQNDWGEVIKQVGIRHQL